MKAINTFIEDLIIIEPTIFKDDRGYFFESYSEEWFRKNVSNTHFVQDNQSLSTYGVLRGLHFQRPPHQQAKLVRVIHGSVWDIAVDIRPDSTTFGKYFGIELSAQNNKQLFIPRGFAHGFIVMSNEAIFQYKCDNYYHPESEDALIWNDPILNIDWPIDLNKIILSEKDKKNKLFSDL